MHEKELLRLSEGSSTLSLQAQKKYNIYNSKTPRSNQYFPDHRIYNRRNPWIEEKVISESPEGTMGFSKSL